MPKNNTNTGLVDLMLGISSIYQRQREQKLISDDKLEHQSHKAELRLKAIAERENDKLERLRMKTELRLSVIEAERKLEEEKRLNVMNRNMNIRVI